tara:strand:+ start:2329 stop:2952 length:624 start_codon:yes stop_codon:yes gene_type:complete
MDLPYKAYCMSRMLIDKSLGYMYSRDTTDLGKTKRIYNINRGLSGSLYDLTYQPSYIINNIYLGNAYNARNYYNLIENDIGLIINCTEEIPNYFEDHFDYIRVDVKDVNGANIYPYLDETVTSIHDYIEKNPLKDVFVHCFMGSSRSATIVVAYLIKYYKYNLTDAINFIKSRREVINLNSYFYNQLKDYQKYIRNLSNINKDNNEQ